MAETSGFFNSYEGDRKYYVSFLAEYFSSFVGNGVFFGGNYLKVEPVGGNMDITVATGKGWINGYYYANKDAAKTLTVPAAHLTLARIDAVVLRLDLRDEKRLIEAVIKQGTEATEPVAPTLQRDNAMWELKLAEIRVNANVTQIQASNITDYRLNSTACGIVTNFVPNDFTYDSIFNQYTSELQNRMNAWDATKSQQQTDWQNQMQTQQTTFNGKMTEIDTWYANMQANIKAIQNFDFDNTAEMNGSTKQTIFESDGSITENIFITSSNLMVAKRRTVFNSNGSISITNIVYKEDGATPLKQSTSTTTFGTNITEVIV